MTMNFCKKIGYYMENGARTASAWPQQQKDYGKDTGQCDEKVVRRRARPPTAPSRFPASLRDNLTSGPLSAARSVFLLNGVNGLGGVWVVGWPGGGKSRWFVPVRNVEW